MPRVARRERGAACVGPGGHDGLGALLRPPRADPGDGSVDPPGRGSGCESRLGCNRDRDPPLYCLDAPDCAIRREPVRIGLPVDHPAWPDAPLAPVGRATIDRVPLPVRKPTAAKGPSRTARPRTDGRASLPMYRPEQVGRKDGRCYRSSGGHLLGDMKRDGYLRG